MSKYPLACKNDLHAGTIGYDGPLLTFFCRVYLREDDTKEVLWYGGDVEEFVRARDLTELLEDYADINDEMLDRLEEDRSLYLRSGPSALQRQMMDFIKST